MSAIHRMQVEIGKPFKAPANLTFDYQKAREALSVWYRSDDAHDTEYVVVFTGDIIEGNARLVATVCVDGFHIVHLCKYGPKESPTRPLPIVPQPKPGKKAAQHL